MTEIIISKHNNLAIIIKFLVLTLLDLIVLHRILIFKKCRNTLLFLLVKRSLFGDGGGVNCTHIKDLYNG